MPRLLLVDDNPSIHRIAESLLAGSAVELVCVDSAEAALEKLQAEPFDVALLDTVMPGTDGWQLLDRIRATPILEDMPVAMMAGVLDAVDQNRLDTARIQGFLKKPIELRDLADRVRAILASTTRSTANFATVPGAKLEGWGAGDRDVSMFDVPAPPEAPAPQEPEAESDLLILGPEDLLPGEQVEEAAFAAASAAPAPAAPDLVLEELDMEHLHGLRHDEAPAPAQELGLGELGELPEPVAESSADEPMADEAEPAIPAIRSMDLAALEAAPEVEAPAAFALPVALPVAMAAAPIPMEAPASPSMAPAIEAAPAPEPVVAPVVPIPASTGPVDANALVRAIASDPALMDALVKAVVSQAGDRVLREIAWELMPELAAKLKR